MGYTYPMYMGEDLENKIAAETKKGGFRKWLVNTGAAVSFSMAIGSAYELGWLQLDASQWMKARSSTILFHIATGDFYAKYSDTVRKKLGVYANSHWFRKFLTDVATSVTFYTPIYGSILYFLAKADGDQMKKMLYTHAVFSAALGFPYRWYLDKFRGFFGYKQENKK